MKGIIFNLLEDAVVREHDEDTWEDLIEHAGVEGAYTSMGNYGDAQLMALIGAAADTLDVPADEVERWFGRAALPLLRDRYPDFFTWHTDVRGFVLSVNTIIHPEVGKLYPGAQTPDFGFDSSDPGRLILDYCSPRKLCLFGEGLLHGAADVYGETLEIHQPSCMHRDDAACRIEVTFR